MNKIYAVTVFIIVTFGCWVNHVVDQRNAYKAKYNTSESTIIDINNVLMKERIERLTAETNRDNYLKNLESAQHEIDALKSATDNHTVILRVAAKCPAVPTTTADSIRITAASPELTDNARSAYFAHRADEAKITNLLSLCVKTLKDERNIK